MRLILSKNFSLIAAGVLIMLSTFGCMTRGWYEERAVNRARSYIFEKCRFLSQSEIEFVKYHKPVVMTEDIVGFTSNRLGKPMPLSQICFAWLLPNREKALIAFGWGSGDFNDWEPNRVFWKRYDKPNKGLISARDKSALYAINHMLFMERGQINRVRFTTPKLVFTNFDLNKGKVPFEDEADARKKLLDAGAGIKVKKTEDKKNSSSMQVSFYWLDPVDPNSRIVVSGFCSNASLAEYDAVSARFVNADELLTHTLETQPQVIMDNSPDKDVKTAEKDSKTSKKKKKR